MAKKIDQFTTGAVQVSFKKDLPYMGKDGVTPNPKLKDTPQFKKGQRAKLHFRMAGKLTAAGYCDILDDQKLPVDTKIVAKKKD